MTTIQTDAGGRPLALRPADLQHLFRPRTVAVIGASDGEGQGGLIWRQMQDRLGALGAKVIPVNPGKAEVGGVKAYPSVTAIPDEVDLAVVSVRDTLKAVEDCVEKGVGFALVFSSGFAELRNDEGRAAQARLAQLGRGKTRIIGPNTALNFFEPWLPGKGKKLAVISQSGYQGRSFVQGEGLGIGIDLWATVGNEADVEWADFVDYFSQRENVDAIISYVEGFHDGRTMMLAADAAARRGIPLIVVKIGRSESGRKMAAAHTGHLTGADAVHDAVFRQFGVIRVDDFDEAVEIAGLFCHAPPVKGGGVGIFGASGGAASHAADILGLHGVAVPRLTQETIDKLGEHLAWFLMKDNPVDCGGVIVTKPEGLRLMDLIIADPNVDIFLTPFPGLFKMTSDPVLRHLIALHRQQTKPVVAVWNSPHRDDPVYRELAAEGVPLFHSVTAAARGMKALADHARFVRDYRSPFTSMPRAASPAAATCRKILAGRAALNEVESKALLKSYGIPVVEERVVQNAAEALTAAKAFGGKVVMKVVSADIAHKSDLGLVAVGIAEADVMRTFDDLMQGVLDRAPQARLAGIVVQPMVGEVVAEVILGLSHQAPFGPTITYGLGGIFAEVFKDMSFRVPPFSREGALAMIEETKGVALLRGARGRPAGDIDALVDAIMALQTLAIELGGDIAELDINPLMVLPRGRGVVAVDALIVPGAPVKEYAQ